jgi:hypothetical protein
MSSIADVWWNEDRRELFRSVEALASAASDAARLSSSFDTILNDLELYDDPRQGAGAWLFENELQLHNVVGDEKPVAASAKAVGSSEWPNVQATAAALLKLMEANGDFTR